MPISVSKSGNDEMMLLTGLLIVSSVSKEDAWIALASGWSLLVSLEDLPCWADGLVVSDHAHTTLVLSQRPQVGFFSSHFFFLVLHCKQPARDLGEAPTNLSLLKVPGRLWAVSNCELFERLVLLIPLLLIPKSSSVIFILRGPWERW